MAVSGTVYLFSIRFEYNKCHRKLLCSSEKNSRYPDKYVKMAMDGQTLRTGEDAVEFQGLSWKSPGVIGTGI